MRHNGPMRHVLAATLILLTGCRSLGYYAHVTHGQVALLAERRSIDKVVADPKTPDHHAPSPHAGA